MVDTRLYILFVVYLVLLFLFVGTLLFLLTEHLCKYSHHWIFLRRTVNNSHLSFTCTGQAITLFCFPDLKRPAVDLQGSTASQTQKKDSYTHTHTHTHTHTVLAVAHTDGPFRHHTPATLSGCIVVIVVSMLLINPISISVLFYRFGLFVY